MSSIGTFGSYTQARLAIYASQAGLSVTGNNIANINTYGYTRQRLEQSSFYAGGADRYYSSFGARTGNGVLCTGVSQLRDPIWTSVTVARCPTWEPWMQSWAVWREFRQFWTR